MNKTQLPNTLHELLHTALEDIRIVPNSEDVEVDMRAWITKNTEDDFCTVCLAGAVMHYRLNMKPTHKEGEILTATPDDVKNIELENKLLAIDSLRDFEFDDAHRQVHKKPINSTKEKHLLSLVAECFLNNEDINARSLTNFEPFDVCWDIYAEIRNELKFLGL